MEHVKHQVKLQKFNFGKQKSTTSAVPFLSGGLFELLSQSQDTRFCYKEPVYKEPTCRRPKYLKNLYY